MNSIDIIRHRLANQQITHTAFTTPHHLVSWFGAIQSQDWPMAKWALGLRLPGSNHEQIESAFNSGQFLRTHVLRPTWHFVAPEDIRWMLQLTASRVHQLNALYYRKFELTPKLLGKTEQIMSKALAGNTFLTREQLNDQFAKQKIHRDRLGLSYIMMHAELEGLICSGPRDGKQFTYALIEERAPKVKKISRDEALGKLSNTYFASHGPATQADFAWWSGLSMKDVKEGVAMLDTDFVREEIEGQTYFFKPIPLQELKDKQTTFLIPDYDEYGIGYKDRSVYHHPKWKITEKLQHAEFFHAISVEGYFGGNWSKTMKGNTHMVEAHPFPSLTKGQLKKVDQAVKAYLTFFGSG